MRRLVHHAAIGLGCTALAVGAAVSGLGSPAGTGPSSVIAVPAPVTRVTVAADSSPAATVNPAEPDRSGGRALLAATAVEQAVQRTAALASQSRSIDRQQARIAAANKAAAAEKRAAAAAKKAAAAQRAAQRKAAAAAKKARVAKERAKAAREKAAEAAAEKARRARIRAQGYEPSTTEPRDIARQILQNKFGYGAEQFRCFDNIIIRESNWDIDATNPSSGAYGIPQALPGSKMATVAGDWRTNPATQIIWAVGYMKDRYGSPCAAWSFKSANGWY